MADSLKDLHNQGQSDGKKGEYNPPHDLLDLFVAEVSRPQAVVDQYTTENKAYNEGHQHNWEQTHRGCFLTTACVEHAGLADDCHQLTTLRRFRDDYVASLTHGARLLEEYYRVAPRIVERIRQDPEHDAILANIFALVNHAVALIEDNDFAGAFQIYETMFARLQDRYATEP